MVLLAINARPIPIHQDQTIDKSPPYPDELTAASKRRKEIYDTMQSSFRIAAILLVFSAEHSQDRHQVWNLRWSCLGNDFFDHLLPAPKYSAMLVVLPAGRDRCDGRMRHL